MFYVFAAAIGIVIAVADMFILGAEKKKLPLLILRDGLGCNAATLMLSDALLRFIDDGKPLFPIDEHVGAFPYLYAVLLIMCGAVWIFLTGVLDRKFTFIRETGDKKKHIAIRVVSVVLATLGAALFTATVWGIDTFGNITPDQMIINVISPSEGASSEVTSTIFYGPVYQTALVLLFFSLFVFSGRTLVYHAKNKEIKLFPLKARRIVSLIMSILIFTGGLAYGVKEFRLVNLFKMYLVQSSFIEDNFADPREVKMQFPDKKRNLVFIYLESMENSYTSKEQGGYMDEDLLAPLTELSKEGYNFSHLDEGFGGPVTMTGGNWSVASMVNMNTGLPMKVPTGGNSYGTEDGFLPGAVTMGDILAAEGYEQSLMFGATATFGGLRYFYGMHGGYNILDYDAAKEKGWIPENYNVWWGFEDDKLFEFAKNEITRLYETGKPFNFVMETADTHFPDGYVGVNTPTPRESQYANVIAYSASEVTKFVRWIQAQPFYDNTTIVLIGDHLSMDKKFFADFSSDYLRTTFNLILNPAPELKNTPDERTHNRWWANIDMFPTIMASLGVKIDGDKLGLGTNLFSDKDTLFEANGGREGCDMVNKEFGNGSKFYNENILEGEYKPFDTKNITEYHAGASEPATE